MQAEPHNSAWELVLRQREINLEEEWLGGSSQGKEEARKKREKLGSNQ